MSFTSPSEQVRYELNGNVARVTLNRPEAGNALTAEMHEALKAIWIETNTNLDVRAIILTGAGGVFCAGDDAAESADRRQAADDTTGRYGHRPDAPVSGLLDRARGLPGKPLIAVVNGRCAGAALGLVAESDFAIASDDATFIDDRVERGQSAGAEAVASVRLRGLPRGLGLRLTYAGEYGALDAERAREVGLVTEVVPADEAQARADALAAQIAAAPPLVTRAITAALWDTWSMPYDQARTWVHNYTTQIVESADAREGLLARHERRAPVWSGR